MLIEFELNGSKCLHKGIFDTNGFWVRFEPEMDGEHVDGYKLFSHFSFAFYHEESTIARDVFDGLCLALTGANWEKEGIGFIRELC